MSQLRFPADDAFADVQRLLEQLSEFQLKHPQFEDQLAMLCRPVNLGRLSWKQDNIIKAIKNCENVLRCREAYEKEMTWVRRTQEAQLPALDKVLPLDAICHVVAFLQHYDFHACVDVCTTFREAVQADSRFDFSPPLFQPGSSEKSLALKQYRFVLEHGSKMRDLRLDMLVHGNAFPLRRLHECLRMCINLNSVELFGTCVEQQAMLDTLAEVGAPVTTVTIAHNKPWCAHVDTKTENEEQTLSPVCIAFRNLPVEEIHCPNKWLVTDCTFLSFDGRQASAALRKIEPAPSCFRVSPQCSFMQLTSLTVSYLDVDFVALATSEVILFPCLESLTIERMVHVAVNHVFPPGTMLEPFGFHSSVLVNDASGSVVKHLPHLHTLAIKFLSVQSWVRPYQKPHDPSLPAPPQPLYVHETPIFEQDCFVANQLLPAFVYHLRATLINLTLSNWYYPILISRYDDPFASSITTEWLRDLSVFTREQDTRSLFGRVATEPPMHPSFEFPCSLAINPSVVQNLTIQCTLPVPYLFLAGRSVVMPSYDNHHIDNVIPPLQFSVEFPFRKDEWSGMNMFNWMQLGVGDGSARRDQAQFSFGIDARMVTRDDVQVRVHRHYPSRGAELLVSCEMHARDIIAKAFCAPNTSWLTDVGTISQRLRHLHTLQLSFPHTGMGATFKQTDRFLHLIDMPHLTCLKLEVESVQECGVFGRTTFSPPIIRPVATLDLLPSLQHLSTKWFHVHWKHNVCTSLQSLSVIGGLCRSNVEDINDNIQDEPPVSVSASTTEEHPTGHSTSSSEPIIITARQELQPWVLNLHDMPELKCVTLDPLCVIDDSLSSRFSSISNNKKTALAVTQRPWHIDIQRCVALESMVVNGEREARAYSITICESPKLAVMVLAFMHLVRLVSRELPRIRMVVLAGMDENASFSSPDFYMSLHSTLQHSLANDTSKNSTHRMILAPDFHFTPHSFASSVSVPGDEVSTLLSSSDTFTFEQLPKPSKWYYKQVHDDGRISRQRHFVHWSLIPLLVHLSPLLTQCSIRPPHSVVIHRQTGSTMTVHDYLMGRRTRCDAEGYDRIADAPLSHSANEQSDSDDD